MARRSWQLNQIIEILEHWQSGRSIKAIARSLGVDRKTVRKYVGGIMNAGITREDRLDQQEWAALLRQQFPELDHVQRSPTHSLLESAQGRDARGSVQEQGDHRLEARGRASTAGA